MNAATSDDLAKLPDANDQLVRAIIENQPYVSIPHFRREIGKLVPPDRVAVLEKHLYLPVYPNGADTETLRQLPGVDVRIALELAKARPYASAAEFMLKLGEMVSVEDLEAARGMIVRES